MNLNDDIVRIQAIEAEAERLSAEARRIPAGGTPLELARLSAIEDAMAMLLEEARVLHARVGPEIERLTAEVRGKKKRRRLFSLRGTGAALLGVAAPVVSFLTNPILVLIVVLALFFHTTQIA